MSRSWLAKALGERPALGGKIGDPGWGTRRRPARQGCRRPRMNLADDPVPTARHRRSREGQDEVAPARGMGRIDDHGQMCLALEYRDRAQIQRVAGRGLEGPDATLAEDDALV